MTSTWVCFGILWTFLSLYLCACRISQGKKQQNPIDLMQCRRHCQENKYKTNNKRQESNNRNDFYN